MDSHEINIRQKRRKQEAQKRLQKRRKRRLLLLVSAFLVVIAVIICLIIILVQSKPQSENPEITEATANLTDEETVIHLNFAGDVNITNKVIEAGYSPEGYNYKDILKDVLPVLADADNTVVNFEGNLCGPPYGTTDTKAPQELVRDLSESGVDMFQIANSYTINNGMIGLEQTLSSIKKAGIEPLGAYATPEDAQKASRFTMRNIHGIKVAFVAFTKGMDSMRLPDGKERCVNLLYEDYTSTYQTVDTEGITAILENVAAAQPDLTIALLHWGSEYNSQVSDSQKKIAALMQENGVDAIIGTHSHYVQEIEFDSQSGQLVAYSLGDLLGDADRSRSSYSIALKLEVKKNNRTGETAISSFDYTPIYIDNQVSEDGDLTTRLLRIPSAIAEYEANGITKVRDEAYQAMKAAQNRLEKLFSDTRKLSEREE